ncbi:MAG: CRISPR-associated helicase Cas3' [Acidobacteria bacterium]|nr:CRISPR-associated helicase Cas3' [Acidobacteriota bacterium]
MIDETKIDIILALLWAKTSHDSERLPDAFHPLICHMMDVACVAEAIWSSSLPDVTKRRLARPFGLDHDLKRAGTIIAWLAGLHDLGKCSPPFTLRGMHKPDTDQTNRLYRLYVNSALHCDSCSAASEAPHGFVTSITLPRILEEEFSVPNRLAREFSELIGGHHGIFANSTNLQNIKRAGTFALGRDAWTEARKEHVQKLREILCVDLSDLKFDENTLDRATGMIFAGLVSVADWIGSDASFFECRIPDSSKPFDLNIEEYLADSRKLATKALSNLGWNNWPRSTQRKDFDELFSFIMDKRDLQQEAIDIAEGVDAPGIFVIEAPMGEGKTEAAMYLADAVNAKIGTRGIYFALPTMATSDQMFGRVAEFLKGRFGNSVEFVNLMLQHGHASLSDEFADTVKSFRQVQENIKNVYSDENDDRGWRPDISNVAAAEWFTYRKRGLLAPFGVGTIDQILFAALQTKHVFVRLFGLAHRTIIIDEVHAYDAYMTELLERLLEWLAALGSPVIILSATLPKDRRDALIKAYLKGSRQEFRKTEMPTATGDRDEYPRISYAFAGDTDKTFSIRQIETSLENARTLTIEWKDDESFVEELKTKLAGGGCAAIICNTVGRAQEVYDFLKADDFFSGDASDGKPKLDLLHARNRFIDRQEREKRVLLRFGKAGSKVPFTENGKKVEHDVKRPDMAVLVSTQIIEQSLDLDFDLMISEIAPVDLLLQRSGRLQRHDRESDKISEDGKRPIAFRDPKTGGKNPSLWILRPPLDESGNLKLVSEGKEKGLPDFGTSGLVYDKHILLRTWLLLRNRESIDIPSDVEELIEAVYGQNILTDEVFEVERPHLEITRQHYESERDNVRQQAQSRYINHPRYRGELSDLMLYAREEESPELHPHSQAMTRLVEPTAQVVCLWESDGRIYVDEALQTEVDLEQRSPREIEKLLVMSSVGVSSKAVVFEFFKEEPPTGWQRSPLLRRHRILKFGPDGKCEKFGRTFELHPEKGLLIYKKEEN